MVYYKQLNILAEIGQGEKKKLRLMREEEEHQNKFYYFSHTAFLGPP